MISCRFVIVLSEPVTQRSPFTHSSDTIITAPMIVQAITAQRVHSSLRGCEFARIPEFVR
jgi:hypothetical protein